MDTRARQFFPALERLHLSILVWINERRLILLRILIVLGVVLLAILFGMVATRINPLYVLVVSFGPLLLVALQAILHRFDLSPLLILLTALFIPFSLPTGTGSRLVIALVVTCAFVGIWIIYMVAVEKSFRLKPFPINKPLLAFMGVTLFSVAWSIVFRDPLVFTPRSFIFVQVASAVVMIMLPASLLIVANFVNSMTQLKVLAGVMLFAGAIGLLKRFNYVSLPVNVEGMFNLWIIGLSVGIALFNRQLPLLARGALVVLGGTYVFWGIGLHISWVAGWLPGMIALGVLCVMRSRKMALVFAACALVVVLLNSDYILGKVIKNEEAESGSTRLAAWKSNWGITRDHLLFGTGPAGYAVYYMTYFPQNAMATHSNYIDILAQTGIVGFAFCMWFFGTLIITGFKICRRLSGRGDWAEALANVAFAGAIACVVIMAFGDWLFPFAYTQTIAGYSYAVYNWLFMGMILAVDRLTREETVRA